MENFLKFGYHMIACKLEFRFNTRFYQLIHIFNLDSKLFYSISKSFYSKLLYKREQRKMGSYNSILFAFRARNDQMRSRGSRGGRRGGRGGRCGRNESNRRLRQLIRRVTSGRRGRR